MRFKPKTEDEVRNLLPDGDYNFECIEAIETTSSKGNEMVVLRLNVFHGNRTLEIRDYIVEKMAHKLRHFCYSVGLEQEYEAGEVQAVECEGRRGVARIRQEEGDSQYPPKNIVKDYVAASRNGDTIPKEAPVYTGPSVPKDQDIPF